MAEADEPDGTAPWWSDEVDAANAARRALVYSQRFARFGRDLALDFPAECARIGTPGGDQQSLLRALSVLETALGEHNRAFLLEYDRRHQEQVDRATNWKPPPHYIPPGPDRDALVVARRKEGKTFRTIAEEFGISAARARMLWSRAAKARRSADG